MLIDDFLPKYDFVETHDIRIHASKETVFEALNKVDLCESSIIRYFVFPARFAEREIETERFAEIPF